MKKDVKIVAAGIGITACLVLLALAACNLPGTSSSPTGEGARAVPATPFLEGAAVAYGDDVLILREVGASTGSAIDRVVIWLPADIASLSLFVNGNAAGTKPLNDAYLIEISPADERVLLEFQDSSSTVIKRCQLEMEDILNPEGDCAW